MNTNLSNLRNEMKKAGVDIYILPNTDPHQSEYIGDSDRAVLFLSGFSGSNATVVVTQDEAGLWTDGRYFIQAEKQLKNSDISLFRMTMPGVPTVREFVKDKLPKGGVLGFDGRLISKKEYDEYEEDVKGKKGSINAGFYALDKIWKKRPQRSAKKLWILEENYSGYPTAKKLADILKAAKKKGAKAVILNDLCDIAYTLNLRGDDVSHVPVFFSYLYISKDEVMFFVQKEALSGKVKNYLKKETKGNLKIYELEEVYDKLTTIKPTTVYADPSAINISLVNALSAGKMVYGESPVHIMRSVKNKVEIKNSEISHINDGVALTKWIYAMKKKYKKAPDTNMTETEASDLLLKYRKKIADFIDESFAPICAYGPNAAMMHYSAVRGEDAVIKNEGYLLIDSGGHYLTGTTDVTRTIAMGELTQEQKVKYTQVLRSHLALMNARFPKGVSGENLDVISRVALWSEGKDYLCGTGHGVGYLLSVHEGPQGIRWRYTKEPTPMEPGMITTDEPGYYEEGNYGIRIENELLCVKDQTTEYGIFYKFKPLTFVPYEMDAVLVEELTVREKEMLNDYNKMIYKVLAPKLTKAEAAWLKEVTKEV